MVALGLVALAVAIAGGLASGLSAPVRVARGVFIGSSAAYGVLALIDFGEHCRLEKQTTGRYLSCKAIPLAETVNHVAIVATVIGFLVLARPYGEHAEARDWFVLAFPVIFLALGWSDELVFHRHRTHQRENIIHTTTHAAAAAMFASTVMYRVVDWT